MTAAALVWDRGPGGMHRTARYGILSAWRGDIAEWLAERYNETAGPEPVPAPAPGPGRVWDSWLQAGAELRANHAALIAGHPRVAFSEAELAVRAETSARLCAVMHRTLDRCRVYAAGLGIDLPEPGDPTPTPAGIVRRCCSPAWWRRQFRAVWGRTAETVLRDLGRVHRHRDVYCSRPTVERRRQQKARQSAFLRERVAVCAATGEQLELWDVAKKSVSNPALRRAEFMVRIRGFEAVAADLGHAALFFTLTTPSGYHARTHDGEPNPRYSGQGPKAGQQYLCRVWARVRAKLKRLAVAVYGFRIAEPHHDGTPHWHLLLWVPAGQAATLQAVLRGYALAEAPDEPGAREFRVKVETIDPAKGGATAYVAKYVAKNIDGHAVGLDDEAGQAASESVTAVDAWASCYRVRQFQQVGGPPVGLWRELRRAREPVECEALERCRAAADAGDWAGFVRALGGVEHWRAAPVRLEKQRTGEENEWGEVKGPAVVGVRCGLVLLSTRHKVWTIQRRESSAGKLAAPRRLSGLGPVSITVRGHAGRKAQPARAVGPDGPAAPAGVATTGPP